MRGGTVLSAPIHYPQKIVIKKPNLTPYSSKVKTNKKRLSFEIQGVFDGREDVTKGVEYICKCLLMTVGEIYEIDTEEWEVKADHKHNVANPNFHNVSVTLKKKLLDPTEDLGILPNDWDEEVR